MIRYTKAEKAAMQRAEDAVKTRQPGCLTPPEKAALQSAHRKATRDRYGKANVIPKPV